MGNPSGRRPKNFLLNLVKFLRRENSHLLNFLRAIHPSTRLVVRKTKYSGVLPDDENDGGDRLDLRIQRRGPFSPKNKKKKRKRKTEEIFLLATIKITGDASPSPSSSSSALNTATSYSLLDMYRKTFHGKNPRKQVNTHHQNLVKFNSNHVSSLSFAIWVPLYTETCRRCCTPSVVGSKLVPRKAARRRGKRNDFDHTHLRVNSR